MALETRFRVFKIVRTSTTRRDVYHHALEGCSPDEFATEQEAREWLEAHGDFRNALHEYVILPCLKVAKQ